MNSQEKNAGHVVYILEPVGAVLECVVRVTALLNWKAFSEVEFPKLKRLFGDKYAGHLAAEDRSILMGLLQMMRQGKDYPALESGEFGYEIFRKMVGSGRLFFSHGRHLRLKWVEALQGSLDWEQGVDGRWRPVANGPEGARVFALNPPVFIEGEACECGEVDFGVSGGLAARWLAAGWMEEKAVSDFCLRLAKAFPEDRFPTPACAQVEEVETVTPRAVLTLQSRVVTDKKERDAVWVDLQERLRLKLRFRYGGALVDWDAEERAVSFRAANGIQKVPRLFDWEAEAKAQLERWGLAVEGGGELGLFNFDGALFALREGYSWRTLLQETFPSLDEEAWEVERGIGFKLSVAGEEALYSESESIGKGEFAIDYGVEVDGVRLSLLPLMHHVLRRRKKGMKLTAVLDWLKEGSFAAKLDVPEGQGIKDWLCVLPNAALLQVVEHLYEVFDKKPFGKDARARVNQWRLGELVANGLLAERAEDGVADVVRLCERLKTGFAVQPREAPAALQADLRTYQKSGLGWLQALSEVAAGGVLADDMGLGKTVQTIAHLLELKQSGRLGSGALIVAPTSVLDNWVSELGSFAPGLRVGVFYGSNRDAVWEERERIDVMVTSYSLLWREAGRFVEHEWDLAILDEAQYIKNAASRTAMAARLLKATRRLCLTGTPVENRLEDIWSLFEFLLPGFLGDEETFRTRLARTLKDEGDTPFAAEIRERLRARLAPFVLRRSKSEVLTDLPEKTEVNVSVAMTATQAELYESVRKEASDGIRRELQSKGIAGARILILSRLLRLRQICCDPRLVEQGRERGDGPGDSAKLLALLDLVERLEEQGSRMLIFSQFTSMLELIGDALRETGRDFLSLTGSTRNRGELVQRFQEGACGIFLISLKAGGSGLNLTAADSVIHYDPWWNPAVERQASDRAHRIGQQKPVFVYKLVTDESIESRIIELQQRKLDLVEGLLSEGDVEQLEIDEATIDFLLGG